jgi:hypothetical protein
MTAVLHTIELFIPGTVSPSRSSKEYRISPAPAPVTMAARRLIVNVITNEQMLWSLLVVAVGLVYGLMVIFSARQRGLAEELQRESLRPVLIAGSFLLAYLHLRFGRQRRFVMTAPVAVAEVVETAASSVDEEAAPFTYLALRYTPLPPAGSAEQYTMLDGPCLPIGWAELDGFSANFERTVRAGDRVSLLYDVEDPAHVRAVEI